MQFRRVSGRDSAQVVTPFVQVGTSCDSTVTSGTDYAFISSLDESPRVASAVDLPSGMTEASPFRDQSLRGHASLRQRASHGITRCDARRASPLWAGLTCELTLARGSCVYPTRNFATLGKSVTPTSYEMVIRSFLPDSLCRHRVRTISSAHQAELLGVQSLRVPHYFFESISSLLASLVHRER